MEFPDLEQFPKGHPPSPYGKPARIIWCGYGTLPKGHILKAVGRIETEGFPSASVASAIPASWERSMKN